MKVEKVNITDTELSAEIDLFSDRKNLSDAQKSQIQKDVADYLVEQTLLAVGEERSPISGGSWKKSLAKEYAKKKLDEIGNKASDLQFTGRMLDQVKAQPTAKGVKIGVFGERAPAADGHNNLSGKSQLPTRQFIPGDGQNYKRAITTEVERIIADISAEATTSKTESTGSIKERKQAAKQAGPFKDVGSQKDLYAELKNIFGNLSKNELRLAVFRNSRILDQLADADLLDFL